MGELVRDLRFALRTLTASPGFAAVAVLSLALGMGVNTAIFSAVDQALIRVLPVRAPQELVSIKGSRIDSYPFYKEFRERNRVFSGLLAVGLTGQSGVRPEGAREVELADVSFVSGNFFETLGVGAARGRVLTPADDQKPGGGPVIVLSYDYWQRRLQADAGVIGRKFVVNGYPLEIAGVAEIGFRGLLVGDSVDAFVPITMSPLLDRGRTDVWNSPNMFWLYTMGRLKAGISREQAQASLRVAAPQIAEEIGARVAAESADGKRPNWKPDPVVLEPGAQGMPMRRERMADPLRILVLAAGFVLLIACANVANLLLARAAGRGREIAVRLALGAGRGRIVRQLLTESLLLAASGAALGAVLAFWGIKVLAGAASWGEEFRLQPDLRLGLFAFAITIATTLLFGLAPAMRATRVGVAEAMKQSGSVTGGRSRYRLGRMLVALQVALSLTLIAGAGLFVQTLRNLRNVESGFQRENVLLVDVDPTNLGYEGQRLRAFYDQFLERVRAIHGVRAASLCLMTPLGNYAMSRTFSAEGYQPKQGEQPMAFSNAVSPGYFAGMGISMLLGRDFGPQDESAITPRTSFLAKAGRSSAGSGEVPQRAMKSLIVSEALARKYFHGQNPIGKRLNFDDRYAAEGSLEIVGVTRDVHYAGLKQQDPVGMIYVPNWGEGAGVRFLAMRTSGDPKAMISSVRQALHGLDADVPLGGTHTLEEAVNNEVGRERMLAALCSFFGLLSLALAAVGLYGVMAYTVAQRTREIGIRMALGAERASVARLVLRESLLPVVGGIAAGLAGAFVLARLIESMLYGVKPRDPVSLAAAAIALLGVGLAASIIPANRASRVEPSVALRSD